MELHLLKPKKALNKAFLKVKPNRTEIEGFKSHLIQLLDHINDDESEEFHKNLVIDFLKKTYYDPNHFINTKGRNDLVIHNGDKATTSVGVIVEAKKPTNRGEMVTKERLNVKAFQELVLYYLRERITQKNIEVKHLIITNINEWFIFDAVVFDRLFAQNKGFVQQFKDFENRRLADISTDFFYKQVAEPFIAAIKQSIEFTHFNIRDYENPLRNDNKKDDNQLIALFKLLSPEHLLKLPFVNDSNSLDKRFYGELLHIIGLEETKEGSKKVIGRKKKGERNSGSFLENAIIQLDSLDKISRLDNPNQFGETTKERLFNVGLELSITWINRILFLKLLEAQLITYHKGDKSYEFLNFEKIPDYDALNKLFFQVLAREYSERTELVQKAFEKVPYLNSSLFEPNEMEHKMLFISNLEDDYTLPIYSASVLKDEKGKRRTGKINQLEYLFEFLSSYDFTSEGGENIQEENKTLINASVLGLIFEKINGYKDGSFFTPGFITMYMCRETIRKAVVQKFNEAKNWNCTDIPSLYDKIEDRNEANEIINDLKICDPAVGSGHFLVSALNEMLAIKNDLRILQDREGQRLKEYHFEVVNDELIVTDEEGELFEYNPNNRESQRVQEALFHEKQTIIENCLFGVDINPNSVKICRLRLWIELLKNAYYKTSPPSQGGVPVGGGGSVSSVPASRGGLSNLPHLKTFRKELRNNLTPAEATLWTMLKGKALDGRKFRRQHSVANYILDFYCPEEHLAVELDGQGHLEASQAEYDQERDLFLKHTGIKVLRFENKWVWDNPQGVLQAIRNEFGKHKPPRPSDTPPYEGGEQKAESGSFNSPSSQGGVPAGGGGSYPNIPAGRGGSSRQTSFQRGEIWELETLPNIDINIKCGNSLVSRFALDADLKQALKTSKWTIDGYRVAVQTYRNAHNKEQKREMERLIANIKSDFKSEISLNDPKVKRLGKLKGELFTLTQQTSLFDMSKKEKSAWDNKVTKLTQDVKKLETEIEEIKSNKIYENAFEWRFEFPEVLNDDGKFVGFDVVIGNPPYFQIQYSNYSNSAYFKSFIVFERTGDVYSLFFEKSVTILKKSGILTFITSNRFCNTNYGLSTREYLSKYNLLELINFNNVDIFDEANVGTIIISLSKEKAQKENKFRSVQINDLKLAQELGAYSLSIEDSTKQKYFGKEQWVFADNNVLDLKFKIQSKSILFSELDDLKINRGITTGANSIFIIPKEMGDRLISQNPKNSEIIKPVLKGAEIKRFEVKKHNNYIILTKTGVPIENYPDIYEYLLENKKELEKVYEAKKGAKQWYELRKCSYYDSFKEEKLIWTRLSSVNSFAISTKKEYSIDSTSFATGENLKYYCVLLNSKLTLFYFKLGSVIWGADGIKWFGEYFNSIPIIKLENNEMTPFIELYDKIILTKQEDPHATAIQQ